VPFHVNAGILWSSVKNSSKQNYAKVVKMKIESRKGTTVDVNIIFEEIDSVDKPLNV